MCCGELDGQDVVSRCTYSFKPSRPSNADPHIFFVIHRSPRDGSKAYQAVTMRSDRQQGRPGNQPKADVIYVLAASAHGEKGGRKGMETGTIHSSCPLRRGGIFHFRVHRLLICPVGFCSESDMPISNYVPPFSSSNQLDMSRSFIWRFTIGPEFAFQMWDAAAMRSPLRHPRPRAPP